MKHSIHSLLFIAAALFVIVSCNSDDETTAPPAPTFKLSGQSVDPATGDVSQWATNNVSAELSSVGLRIKAVRGVDTLFIAIANVDSGAYFIDQEPPLGPSNRIESAGENGFTLYTFQANGNGGGVFNITQNDSLNRTITGDFSVKYFNPINNSDFIELNNVQFRNLSYGISGSGPQNLGEGSISFTADGVDYAYDDATGEVIDSVITIIGFTPPLTPSITISIGQSLEPGVYPLDGSASVDGLFVLSVTEFFGADTGRVEILMHDTLTKNISGNFNFLAVPNSGEGDSLQVTNGVFDMNYDE